MKRTALIGALALLCLASSGRAEGPAPEKKKVVIAVGGKTLFYYRETRSPSASLKFELGRDVEGRPPPRLAPRGACKRRRRRG